MKTKMKGILTLLLAFMVQLTFAQERTISGTITDDMGEVSDISVVVKGSTNGTVTDFDGNYTIKAKTGDTLVFSHVSYNTIEKIVGASNKIDVMMSAGNTLEEVLVTVAYGKVKKEEIAGSVKVIKTKEIAEIQDANVVKGMTGKVSGVQVIQGSGQPGSSAVVRFRGIGSINASSAPLYVVDGVPFNGDINSINNNDIASFTFLKDAASAALYGNRGANGVIIITTKKGRKGKVRVFFDNRLGYTTRATKDYNLITDPADYLVARYNSVRNGFVNQGLDPQTAANVASQNLITNNNDFGTGFLPAVQINYNPYNLPEDQLIDPATGKFNTNANLLYQENWNDYLFRPSIQNDSFLSMSKADDTSNYYFSAGYSNNDGYVVGSGFKRITTQLKVDSQIFKFLNVGASINYANTKQNSVDGDGSSNYSNPLSWSRSVAPIYPVYAHDALGNRILDNNGQPVYDDGTGTLAPFVRAYGQLQNPVAGVNLNLDETGVDNLSTRISANFDLTNDMKFTYNITGELLNSVYKNTTNPLYGDAADPQINGRVYTQDRRLFTLNQQQLLNWNKKFGTEGNSHTVSLLLGHENSDLNIRSLVGSKSNILLPDSPVLDHAARSDVPENYERDYNLDGYFSRLTYDFNSKYYINANIRRDASSVFHPDNRWGTFFGIGAAWRVSKESFMQDVNWLNELKLKASYGQQGNDAIRYPESFTRNYYAYRDQYQLADTPDGSVALALSYRGNKELTWETNKNFNVGFETSFINNRFSVEMEYFKRAVSDLLYNQPSPPSEGLPPLPKNIGDMENIGYELTLGADVIDTDNFNLNFGINATHFKNEITKIVKPLTTGLYRLEEGHSRYDYYLRDYAGVNPNNGSALFYKDVLDATTGEPTGERVIVERFADATRYFVGKSAIPDFYGGFNTSAKYKNFDLAINFAYQIGGYGYDSSYWNRFSSEAGENFHKDVLTETWTPENTTANLPRIDADDSPYNSSSTLQLIDASYLSIQNINIGYTFPSKFTNKLGLSSVRFYGLANNLALWSKRQGYDPRAAGLTGQSSDRYSILSTKTIGLTLNF